MNPKARPEPLRISRNDWVVPSARRALDGVLLGSLSDPVVIDLQRRAELARETWTPSAEAMALVERLRSYIGWRVRIQLWNPIMEMLPDEGPSPFEGVCSDVQIKTEGLFPQAYLTVIDVDRHHLGNEVSSERNASSVGIVRTHAVPVADLFEIEVVS